MLISQESSRIIKSYLAKFSIIGPIKMLYNGYYI